MRSQTELDLSPNINVIQRLIRQQICFQDTIHIGTKLRNRLLNSSNVLCIGDKVVTIVHIKILLESVPKEVHALVQSDIYPEDRQNYKSLEKLMEDRVLNAMQIHVADSEATRMYLKICKHITSSFTNTTFKPIDRIQSIWFALYFLRCWRKSLISRDGYSLEENLYPAMLTPAWKLTRML